MKKLLNFRKIVLSFGLLLFALPGLSQECRSEKVLIGIGAQYNLPARYFNKELDKFDGQNSGIGFYVEPKVLKCNFLFGLKAEYASVQEIFQTDAIRTYNLVSLSPTVKYLFLSRRNSPYVGLGTGLYYISNVENNLNWGIEPSAGYIFHKVQLSLNYSRILNEVDYGFRKGFDNYYLAVKLGVEL